jgi:hypothetical protein
VICVANATILFCGCTHVSTPESQQMETIQLKAFSRPTHLVEYTGCQANGAARRNLAAVDFLRIKDCERQRTFFPLTFPDFPLTTIPLLAYSACA